MGSQPSGSTTAKRVAELVGQIGGARFEPQMWVGPWRPVNAVTVVIELAATRKCSDAGRGGFVPAMDPSGRMTLEQYMCRIVRPNEKQDRLQTRDGPDSIDFETTTRI